MNLFKFLSLLCLLLPFVILLTGVSVVWGQEDADQAEGEEDDDEGIVEDDGVGADADALTKGTDSKEDEEEVKTLKPSPYADTILQFIHPVQQNEFEAGREVRVLLGLRNTGEKDIIVENINASIRYPQDFSFYIQNFSNVYFDQTIESMHEATFNYQFTPSDTLSSRTFGLVLAVYYKDQDGEMYQDSVFNSTISIVEPDEGLDGETFFLYVFMIAIVILVAVGAYHFLSTFKKKHLGSKPKPAVETGTQNNKSDVDFDWLPKEVLQDFNRFPRVKTNPKMRSIRRINQAAASSSGSDEN